MNLKFLTVICLLSAITVNSQAQGNADKLFYMSKVEKYRKMKNTGATLTIVGGLLFVGGAVAVANAVYDPWNDESSSFEAGSVALFVGAAGLGSGIPLWIVGANNQRKYTSKLENPSVRLEVNTQKPGLSLILRF